jgi:indoleamine 2,3-dioxygenase
MASYQDGFFSIDSTNGFLPVKQPLKKLPYEYKVIQNLIDELPSILKKENLIEEMVKDDKFINFIEIIKKEKNIFIIQALYRAYAFLVSGYLLEPSYHHFLKTGEYGKGRTILPEKLAVPFMYLCDKLDIKGWLDYHYSYSLGNYVKKNEEKGLHWTNLDMACKFSGTTDEIGFIMLHVYINELSPFLIKSINQVLNLLKENVIAKETESMDLLLEGLKLNYQTLREMNSRRKEMWVASDPKRYNDFRIFIMGSKGNDKIFGEGIVYEGVSEEKKVFRGQTGAQDDIIPTEDIFSGVINYYPENELTKYLLELREYRPRCVQNFLKDLEENSKKFNLFQTLKETTNYEGLTYLYGIVYEIYAFRFGHWQFVQKYIMANTKYPVATGGTPITSWLPNQIKACLNYLDEIRNEIVKNELSNESQDLVKFVEERIKSDNFKRD